LGRVHYSGEARISAETQRRTAAWNGSPARDFYDVWLPDVAPSQELVTFALRSSDEKSWQTFERKYRAEMKKPEAARLLDLLAAMSHQTNFSIGCYCENETRCHRSILRDLLAERGSEIG